MTESQPGPQTSPKTTESAPPPPPPPPPTPPTPPPPPAPNRLHQTLGQILEAEFEALHGPSGEPAVPGISESDRLRRIHQRIHQSRHAALCLSGGGIRSATFNLGVIQALARLGLLGKFHYLSTVSGGGYIGGWLSAWISRDPRGVAGVAGQLTLGPMSDTDRTTVQPPEPSAIRWLRSYSNYLTPQLGLFSADTWTLVATYFRNLLLNWMVFLPLIAAALMLPRLGVWAVVWMGEYGMGEHRTPTATVCFVLSIIFGGLCQAAAVAYMDAKRPSAHPPDQQDAHNNQRYFLWCALLPLVAGAMLITSGWIGVRFWIDRQNPLFAFVVVVGVSLLFTALGIVVGLWGFFGKARRIGWRELVAQGVAALTSGAMLWFFLTRPFLDPRLHPIEYVAFALPLYMAAFLLAGVLLRGLTTPYTADEDREWSARSAGWLLIAALAWAAMACIVLFGPSFLIWLGAKLASVVAGAGALAGAVTGWLARSSRTPATHADRQKLGLTAMIREAALALAAPLFIMVLLIGLAFGTDYLIASLILKDDLVLKCSELEAMKSQSSAASDAIAAPAPSPAPASVSDLAPQKQQPNHLSLARQSSPQMQMTLVLPRTADAAAVTAQPGLVQLCARDWHQQVLLSAELWNLLLWLIVLLACGGVMNHFVSINRYSLNAVYRNRIVRAYLGASRTDREQSPTLNRFTGFDEQDNPNLHEVRPQPGAGPWRLFHVVNMTLNLVGGHELAWQERKAENFTASPLHCGCAELGYRDARLYGGAMNKGSETRPLTLGTAVSISGAAASPNMGYHTSSALAFVMTLLNVRLGAWLGNPRSEKTYGKSQPEFSAQPLFAEAFGLTDDQSPYIYLSDGGHFENLAIYEMVRRRCKYIVVIDAGADVDCRFEDLGNALRKIYIDMGIRIDFAEPPLRIYSRGHLKRNATLGEKARYCAVADILYNEVDETETIGTLLYIKPAIYEISEPMDVLNYSRRCNDFPHETTADQFFSESQFESYRKLGSYIMATIGRGVRVGDDAGADADVDVEQLIDSAWSYIRQSTPTAPPPGTPAAATANLAAATAAEPRTRRAKTKRRKPPR